MDAPGPTGGEGPRTAPVAGKITPAEKRELERVVATLGITLSDALRESILLWLAIRTYEPPQDRPASAGPS